MPLLEGRQQIAIKQEATAGTAETLAAANVVLHKGVATWEPDVQTVPREGMSAALSGFGSVIGSRAATIRFAMYLRGTTGAPVASSNEPDFSVPLKACGANITVSGGGPNEQSSFKPSSTTISDETTGAYSTIALYEDGKRYMIHGAVGNCVLTCATGAPVLAEFEFKGVFNTPTDATLLVPTYPTVIEPAFLAASLSVIGSYTTARISSLRLDFGNTISMRPNPNGAAGWLSAQITGRKPVGSFDPEEVLVSGKDWFAEWIAATTGAITTGVFPSGGTNYNQLSLTVPKAQYTKVGLAARDGIATAPHDFECVRNSDAGDDEWELIQT